LLPDHLFASVARAEEDAQNEFDRKTRNVARDTLGGIYGEHQLAIDASKRQAAPEYLGILILAYVDAYRSLGLKWDVLLDAVAETLTELRHLTIRKKWPTTIPFDPGWEEAREIEFDRALLTWLERNPNWREYEAELARSNQGGASFGKTKAGTSGALQYSSLWPLQRLKPDARRRVLAAVQQVHGAFLEHKFREWSKYLQVAYDLVAGQFEQCAALTEGTVKVDIVGIIADASSAGRWSELVSGQGTQTAIFTRRLGSCYYPIWRCARLELALAGRIADWSGKLLLTAPTPSKETRRRGRPANETSEAILSFLRDLGDQWKTEANLRRLAEHLDLEEVAIDRRWRKAGNLTWGVKLDTDPENFIKAIDYRLRRAKK
jgi:hypothetical protein